MRIKRIPPQEMQDIEATSVINSSSKHDLRGGATVFEGEVKIKTVLAQTPRERAPKGSNNISPTSTSTTQSNGKSTGQPHQRGGGGKKGIRAGK